jgi:hypothetical protein
MFKNGARNHLESLFSTNIYLFVSHLAKLSVAGLYSVDTKKESQ